MTGIDRAGHWDAAFAGGDERRSWYQAWPGDSLRAIRHVAPGQDAPIIDVGGGSSGLSGALLAAGYRDLTVLDISKTALSLAESRLGVNAEHVTWIAGDLLAWRPRRRYFVWHDRAVLHFFTDADDRRTYAETLHEALVPAGYAIIACFAPSGPDQCSGLPVHRSSADEILDLLGSGFSPVYSGVRVHTTPSNREQPFTWVTARRTPAV